VRFSLRIVVLSAVAFGWLHGPEVVSATASGKIQAFSPVAIQLVRPLPENPAPDDGIPPVQHEIKLPEHRAVDEATWRYLKSWAEIDPNAAPPDAIVPAMSLREPAAPLFPGQGRSEGGLNPPDTTVARGDTRLLQAVNSSIALYDSVGNQVDRKTLASFLGAPAANPPNVPLPPFDPKVLFDRNSANPRFFVVATQYLLNPNSSTLWLAVSRSSNPATLAAANWCRYGISATSDFGTSFATFADQPNVGVGADSFVISANHFRIDFGSFTYVVIRAFNKLGLENNAAGCPTGVANVFRPASSSGDLNIMSLQPALHYSSPSSFNGTKNPAYLVNARWPPSTTYRVWRIKDPAGPGAVGQLQVVDVAGDFTFGLPPDAPQSGTTVKLETDDARVWEAQAFGDSIWASHSTLCNIGGGTTEVCVRVVRFNVGQDGSGNPTASIGQQITLGGGADIFYWMPSIAVNASQRTALAFLRSSPTTFLSSASTAKDAGVSSYPAASIFGTGTCARPLERTGEPPRTGDYVGAHTAPDLASFWLSAEHAAIDPPGGGVCNWKTEIIQVN
jgi:hypothetical protein